MSPRISGYRVLGYRVLAYGVLLGGLCVGSWSCGGGASCEKEYPAAGVKVQIARLDSLLFSVDSAGDMQALLSKHKSLMSLFFGTSVEDSAWIRDFHSFTRHEATVALRADVHASYGDLSDLARAFEQMFSRVLAYDSSFRIPRIQVLISGLYRDVYLSDSLYILSLDYFLDSSARYRPRDLPSYMQQRYTPSYVVPLCVLFISNAYNASEVGARTMLSDMIAMGKAYYFMETILPCLADSAMMGYTAVEMARVEQNREAIWSYFVSEQLFYETNHLIKNKYIGERPYVHELGVRLPGRIGMYLGWSIVRAYMSKHTELGLEDLMAESDSEKIFRLSDYRP